MDFISNLSSNRQYPGSRALGAILVSLTLMTFAAGCSSSASGGSSCETDADCSVGTVCTAQGVCEGNVDCRFCAQDQICYKEEDSDGECSVPECGPNANGRTCDDGESCNNGKCVGGGTCTRNSDCPEGRVCNVLGKCVSDTDAGNTVDPDVGQTADTSTDSGPTGDPDVGVDAGSDAGNTCSSGGPSDCPPGHSPEATKWSTEYCACVQCLGDSDCSDGQSCRNGVCQEECAQSCSSSGGSTNCPSDVPYCLSGCCVECVGNADCSGDKVCIDGSCGQTPSDCTDSSVDCPQGYTCNTSNGECEQQQSNSECTENDPTCPPGETCNTTTNTCEPPSGGGGSCGMCGTNCTCPGNLTCSANFACTGCGFRAITDSQWHCPQGQTCFAIGDPLSHHPDNICASF